MSHFSKTSYLVSTVLFLIVAAFFTTAFPLQPEHQFVSSLFVILFALPCYYGLLKSFGKKSALILIISMSIFALILENFAIISGIPYGRFEYGPLIGSKIIAVPWTVGFAWTPILFGAYWLSNTLFLNRGKLSIALSTAVLMTLFDFILDPGSVALGFWSWEHPVGFYQVPWSNFIGWLISSFIAATTLQFMISKLPPVNHVSSWVYSSFMIMIVYWTAVSLFEKLWWPFAIGCILVWSVLLLLKSPSFDRNT